MLVRKALVIALTLILVAVAAPAVTPVPAKMADAAVTLNNFTFTPKKVRIQAGAAVTWTVKEGTHTVRADDGSFTSGTLSAGQSFSQTFEKPGTYKYYCSFHGSAGGHDMAGTVVVTK